MTTPTRKTTFILLIILAFIAMLLFKQILIALFIIIIAGTFYMGYKSLFKNNNK